MKYTVGSIVESICGKCNDVMGHTVMAMVGSEIVKVECRVCKSQHRFRPPVRMGNGRTTLIMKRGRDGEAMISRQEAVAKSSRPAAPKIGTRKPSTAMAAARAALESWQAAMRMHEGETPRPYAMAETFGADEFIIHPTFGPGVVKGAVPPDKMDVLFEVGLKRLLCNKK